MLIRYVTTPSGERKKRAEVYTVDEHGISRDRIDPDALQITRRLTKNGFSAYIVGGAVRDLLIDKTPKDFDVVTDATPSQIRKLFHNARVIGKRFRLVHVRFRHKIFEVSTFRSNNDSEDQQNGNNVYGKMEEDVHRRDFSMNALYYSPKDEYIVDYVSGFNDVRKKRIRCLIPLSNIFADDPVRMMRAVKYSAGTGFTLDRKVRNQIKKNAESLSAIPVSRLTEELFKILGSGVAMDIIDLCTKLNLLPAFLPTIAKLLDSPEYLPLFTESLSNLDRSIQAFEKVSKGSQILGMTRPFLEIKANIPQSENTEPFSRTPSLKSQLFWESKRILEPLTPPNADIDESVRIFMHEKGLISEVHKKRPHIGGGGKRPSRRRSRSRGQKKAPSIDGAR